MKDPCREHGYTTPSGYDLRTRAWIDAVFRERANKAFDRSLRPSWGWRPSVAKGTTRTVLLWRSWAFKVPSAYTWRLFLQGLLANMQEARWGRLGWPELCPVLLAVPGGLLVVMPRCDTRAETGEEEAFKAVLIGWARRDALKAGVGLGMVEDKLDSWGVLWDERFKDGRRLVAVDYGD